MSLHGSVITYILAIVLIIILIWVIHRQVKEHHLQDDPMLHLLRKVLTPIQYNDKSIMDGVQLYKGDKSYTINKEKIFLCLYDENGEYYPLNTVLEVCSHEIAHYLNRADVGHTENFYKIFDHILKEAQKLGIYNPNIPLVQNYCNYK